QNSHYARLAVRRRDDADAEVQLFITDRNLDAAVLRATPLRNVHFRQDFDARDDRSQQTARRAIALMANAIDAVANSDDFFKRLHVDVRGSQLNCLGDHELDEADDGSTVLV